MSSLKLGDAVVFTDTRTDATTLTVENYVGTDNLLQNKEGKKDSLYVPTTGKTAAYKAGDILIANIRPYLKKIWFATNSGGSSADVSTLRVKDGFDPAFIYYNLFQDEFFDFAMRGAKGSKMPRLDKKQILEFPIQAPDLFMQKSIAHTLSLLDNKIVTNRQVITRLEAIAQDVYNFWFVQFEFPDENNQPYKTAGGAMTYNEKLKREIPVGWHVAKVQDLLQKVSAPSVKVDSKSILPNGEYPVITQDVGNVIKGYTNIANPIQDLPLLVFGDHSCTLRYIDFPFFRGADGTQLLKFANSTITNYAYFWLERIIPKIPNYGKYERHYKYVKDAYICMPPNDILAAFSDIVQPLLDGVRDNSKQSVKLADLRNWLLPMLINGHIRVK